MATSATVEAMLGQIFSDNNTAGESLNIGKLRVGQPASGTESEIKRQLMSEMKLSTPEIFKEKKFINEGTFGKVYRAKIGDRLYALKKIKVEEKNN